MPYLATLETKEETYKATGHNFKETSRVEATCGKPGSITKTCENCGEEQTEILPQTQHEYEWKITKKPTDTDYGIRAEVCKNCGDIRKSQAIPAGFQNAQEYTVDLGEGKTTTVYGYFNDAYAEESLKLLNDYRKANGLRELKNDNLLGNVTLKRTPELVVSFSHTRPNGLPASTISSLYNGENIAKGQPTPQRAFEAWKTSPGHNRNMLEPSFTKTSIRCFYGCEYDEEAGVYRFGYYWIQMFKI